MNNVLDNDAEYVKTEAYSFISYPERNDINYARELFKDYGDNREEFVFKAGYIIGQRVDSDILADLDESSPEEMIEFIGSNRKYCEFLLKDQGVSFTRAAEMVQENDPRIYPIIRGVCHVILLHPMFGTGCLWGDIVRTYGEYLYDDIIENPEKYGLDESEVN